MKIKWLLFVFFVIQFNHRSESSFIAIELLKEKALNFIEIININSPKDSIAGIFYKLFHTNSDVSKKIVNVFREIDNHLIIIEKMRLRYQKKMGVIRIYLDRHWPLKYTMKNLWEQFEAINSAYNELRDEFIYRQGHRSRKKLTDFATDHLQYASLIIRYMKHEIESIHFDGRRGTTLPLLITAVLKMNDENFTICNTERSNQQYLLALYLRIIETEAKGIILKAIDKKWQCENADDFPMEDIQTEFLENYDLYQKLFAQVLNELSLDFRACDPVGNWSRGVSYFELERLNQMTLIRATNSFYSCKSYGNYMNRNSVINLCNEDITDSCYYRDEEICSGSLHNCFSAFGFSKCNLTGDVRRVKWFRTKERVYGTPHNRWGYNTSCSTTIFTTTSAACLCDCIQYHNKVSLALTTADISRNRVIIAIRIRKVKNTVFFQIKDGELLANSEIIKPSGDWKPSGPPHESNTKMRYSLESLNLDNLLLKEDEVLTGVGFQEVPKDPHRRVQLVIRGTKFNWSKGTLSSNSRLLSSKISHKSYNFTEKNSIYTRKIENQKLVAESPYYVKFVRSRLCRDFGQSTVPLIDSLPINGDQPLSGIGIFIKSTPGFAGYVSLKLFALDYSNYFLEIVNQYKYDEIIRSRRENHATISKIIAGIK